MTDTSDPTRRRLLEAAERIVIEHGASALTVRRIGAVAGVNGTLVTYHFGTMARLESELARHNLQPMKAAWEPLTGDRDEVPAEVPAIVRTWLAPLLRPATFTPAGRALVVLDELAAHARATLREEMMAAMRAVSLGVQARLEPLLPDLPPAMLAARLRFVAGAALGPPPRGSAGAADLEQLVAFALEALRAPQR